MLRLTVFPADDGDCLLLSYGEAAPFRHIIIDGGRASSYPHLRARLTEIRDAGEEIELLVLTHVDADHIEGVLKIAKDPDLPLAPKHVWFNGFDQLGRIQAFSPGEGDEYSELLGKLGWPLNEAFNGNAASIEAKPQPFEMAGLTITLLSPDAEKLAKMRKAWTAWRTADAAKAAAKALRAASGVQRMGRKAMPTVLDIETLSAPTPTDPEPPNGSSIAFLAEWNGKSVLLAGDAHPDLLAKSLCALLAPGKRLTVDLFKVSHHGSHGNTSREVVEALDCRRFLISTNGKRHGHPDPEAIARLLRFAPDGMKTLYFNYRTPRTDPWDDAPLSAKYGYATEFAGPDGILLIDI
ncbi:MULTISPECIES: ComEC/Rec2 family competence protein [Sphingobium]|uniref:ComEC/Rec2 family competence protein n=1 Tax=Sphingobium TaxID=165695 RepID=UPI0015EB99A0|nr:MULTISPECIES: MBL fold metallo-hydrolase [Sphingobium]MCW2363171.1 beta-lactamase superfamily II metal-dependent hydrolase [Sphingobium sp. B10D3B]MCW2400149.1 beta-lactamase superfamily II metal-dependent hydrolase [Sphingobium sp. B10D7B]MCW2407127.1 beta-lactamase superfamily II metal-dependent hydrolase [Sphingobium xanthum]